MDSQQLTPADRQLLAREVAADKAYPFTLYGQDQASRLKFIEGWDAAMEYVKQQRNPRGEEEQGYPYFSEGGMPLG